MSSDNQEIVLGPETELRIGGTVYWNYVKTQRTVFVTTDYELAELLHDDRTIYAPAGSSIVIYSCHV